MVLSNGIARFGATAGAALALTAALAETNLVEKSFWRFEGRLSAEFESAYLSSSGTLCDTRPTALQNLDWAVHIGDYGKLYGYGCFLSMMHDRQHELHRPAFNEFECGAFYGYDLTRRRDYAKNDCSQITIDCFRCWEIRRLGVSEKIIKIL